MTRILFYDGICGLCHNLVKFVHKYDKKNKIRFYPLQKLFPENSSSQFTTSYYFKNGHLYQKSNAILQLLMDLGYPFRLLTFFLILPTWFRDLAYSLIANIRYSIWGKVQSCSIQESKEIAKKSTVPQAEREQILKAFQERSTGKFLTGAWKNLIMVNYKVDPKILEPFVPKYTELDTYNGDCYVSLVAFEFKNTKVIGIPAFFHRNFEEVNLRFYVKKNRLQKWVRGVVFVKEIVPHFLTAFLARFLYGERYVSMKMKHQYKQIGENNLLLTHEFGNHNKILCQFEKTKMPLIENSLAEFISEHYFGYVENKNGTLEYEVKHPKWNLYQVEHVEIQVDFADLYGPQFSFLNNETPCSCFMAEGSEISVHHGTKVNS